MYSTHGVRFVIFLILQSLFDLRSRHDVIFCCTTHLPRMELRIKKRILLSFKHYIYSIILLLEFYKLTLQYNLFNLRSDLVINLILILIFTKTIHLLFYYYIYISFIFSSFFVIY